ncbi:sce7726 family protein [Haloarcula sp. CBA1122]|uniref:sce7726 family protein n=1 Tax=Haloarcula sp. CBA1122 TaxID=2668069 RepID=UPI0013091110|nr:sce7726 family protein [Haloarcula sp. CBA1122]MUV49292.1 sce7726 family protein [Haloarcula sp. CBA1122]
MATKEELISEISFRYLKKFVIETGVIRKSAGYHTKEDHVQALARALTKPECEFINSCYQNQTDASECSQQFRTEIRPDEEIVRRHFLDYIQRDINEDKEVVFEEFPLGENRADVNYFNGNSFTYELKSPRDSFRRLEKQLDTYSDIFEFISVVLPYDFEIPEIATEETGIIRYDYPEFDFNVEQKPAKIDSPDARQQLQLLWIGELEDIFYQDNEADRDMKKSELISNILNTYSRSEVNNIFKQKIKSRYGVEHHL